MLYVNGEPLSNINLTEVLGLASIQQATSAFLQQLGSSSNSTVPDDSGPYLCLMQGEEASADAKQLPGLIIGSQVCLRVLQSAKPRRPWH
jgi:hypothetical protein